jgi:hypothetical protein
MMEASSVLPNMQTISLPLHVGLHSPVDARVVLMHALRNACDCAHERMIMMGSVLLVTTLRTIMKHISS